MSYAFQLTALALLLLLSLAAAFACAVIWKFVQIGHQSPGIRLTTGAEDRAFPDTSYSVAYGHQLVGLLAVYLALMAILWAQDYFRINAAPALTTATFWLIHLGMLAAVFAPVALGNRSMPRRVIDYEAALAPMQKISMAGAIACLLGLAGRALLLMIGVIKRLRGK